MPLLNNFLPFVDKSRGPCFAKVGSRSPLPLGYASGDGLLLGLHPGTETDLRPFVERSGFQRVGIKNFPKDQVVSGMSKRSMIPVQWNSSHYLEY